MTVAAKPNWFQRFFGLPWRDVADCPHPKGSRRSSCPSSFDATDDIECRDCGALLYIDWPAVIAGPTQEGLRAER
jgi:hypothetical protein